jgi:periplasmic divalent cation tolerance protein
MSAQLKSSKSIVTRPKSIVMVYVTFPSLEKAKELSEIFVTEKLCACVNFWEGHSLYFWQGKIENSKECFAFLKTTQDRLADLKARFHALHPYDIPCWIELSPKAVGELYEAWIS